MLAAARSPARPRAQATSKPPLLAEKVAQGQAAAARAAPAAGAARRRPRASGCTLGQLRRRAAHADGAGPRHPLHGRPTAMRGSSATTTSSSSCPTSSRRVDNDGRPRLHLHLRAGHRWSDGAAVHGRGFPLLLGGRRATTTSSRRPARREMLIVGRRAAEVRGAGRAPRCATPGTKPNPLFLPRSPAPRARSSIGPRTT